jgi:hypothetical protein
MKRALFVLSLLVVMVGLMAGPALGQGFFEPGSPVRFDAGEDGAHSHAAVTPQGCVAIHGPVYFVPDKGPHFASFTSSGLAAIEFGQQDESFFDPTRGIWHPSIIVDPC